MFIQKKKKCSCKDIYKKEKKKVKKTRLLIQRQLSRNIFYVEAAANGQVIHPKSLPFLGHPRILSFKPKSRNPPKSSIENPLKKTLTQNLDFNLCLNIFSPHFEMISNLSKLLPPPPPFTYFLMALGELVSSLSFCNRLFSPLRALQT